MDFKNKEILEGSILLFYRVGIRSVSMDDIAKELRIPKKTIYRYFKNKEDLIESMLRYQLQRDFERYKTIADNEVLNAINVLLSVSVAVCDTLKQVSFSHLFDLKKYYPQQYNAFWNSKREMIQRYIFENVCKGVSQGIYRSDLNTELIALLYAINLEKFNAGTDELLSKYSFEEVFRTMFENHIRAITNQKGLDYFLRKKEAFYN